MRSLEVEAGMREIIKNEEVLARHILKEDIHEGLNFFSQDQELIQAGAWGYDAGKELLAHIHNVVPRTVTRTCEVLYVISGMLEADIFDLDERLIDTFRVKEGEILMLLECGHGYRILENGTKVLEIKNGPYPGAEADRYRIEKN